MPGTLRCGDLDLCSPTVFTRVLEALTALVREPRNRYALQLKNRYYFAVPASSLTSEAGWYIIYGSDALPLYVGTAENLNGRLNTENGSRDGFANPQRTSDPERNFIKAFVTAGILSSLSVVVIPESALRSRLGCDEPLSKLDRENLEKMINIFRARLCGLTRSGKAEQPA